MKRLFQTAALLAVLFSPTVMSAQTDSLARQPKPRPVKVVPPKPHLTFKNVPIDGDIDVFAGRLRANGIVKTGDFTFAGPFAGLDVTAAVAVTPISETVYSVAVHFPSSAVWEETYETFAFYRQKLTEVYGDPKTSVDKFDFPYAHGDGYPLKAMKEKKAHINSWWNLAKGQIYITIELFGETKTRTTITYTDEQGQKLQKEEKDQQIKRDL